MWIPQPSHQSSYGALMLTSSINRKVRLNIIRLATSCKDMLGLSFPDCADFPMDEWNQKIALDMGDRTDEVKVKTKNVTKDLVNAAQIFC